LPIGLQGGEVIIADKGYAGRELAAAIAERHGALLLSRPRPPSGADPPVIEALPQLNERCSLRVLGVVGRQSRLVLEANAPQSLSSP
jgi:hypothetical protein